MNEQLPKSESIFPPGSFADSLLSLDKFEARRALRPVYPAVDIPGGAMMIGSPKEALASCPRAFHVTSTSVLGEPIDIRPLSHHKMEFEPITGRVMAAVLSAFNATKFAERSHNHEYPIPASSEVSDGVFLGNNVSSELLRMSREASIIRPETAKEIAFALALLAWQVRLRSSSDQLASNPQVSLADYAQSILQPLSSEVVANLLKTLPEVNFDTIECTKWALRKIGITGFWSNGICGMIYHRNEYPEKLRPSWTTEEELTRLAKNVPEYIGKAPSDQMRVPLIIEAIPSKVIPILEINNRQIPYVFYSQTRPDSILTVPQLDAKSIAKMWIDPQDLSHFTEYLWLRGMYKLSSSGVQIRRPVKFYEGKQPVVEYVDYSNSGLVIPIFLKEDQDIPTTDFCVNRYPDETSLFAHFIHQLETGDRLFIAQDKYGSRLAAITAYADAIGLPLSLDQKKLVQASVIRYQ